METHAKKTGCLRNFTVTQSKTIQHNAEISQIGDWSLLSVLGEGSLCKVFLARPINQPNMEATYAVKVLHSKWHDDEQVRALFERDAAVGMAVSHKNVAPVLTAVTRKAPFFSVMPKIPGVSLKEHIENGFRFEIPIILWIGRQIASGLQAIQTTCKMTHGDVKPENILISPSGHVTIIDFGFARLPSECQAATARPILGSLRYAAPETLVSALAADARSDIYSLGTVLYELLTGEPTFDEVNPEKLIRQQLHSKPVCLRKQIPNLPKPIASLVHSMLCKEPIRRPVSWQEVLESMMRLEIEWFAERAA